MDQNTNQKRAIVTGAASGIGRAIATLLAENDWTVLAVDLHGDGLNTLAKESNNRIIPCQCDLTANDAPQKIMTCAQDKMQGLDLLVNNAGISYLGEFAGMPTEKIDQVLNLNLRSLMTMCHAAIPLLKKSPRGQIVNIGSLAAHYPMQTIAVYCATKAAVVVFSRVLAKELGPHGIRVNVLSPTGTNTNLFKSVGSDIDTSQLVPPADQAQIVLELTKLPESLDVCEIITDKRYDPLVL
ncbi:MAG: SDR family oxidoreductase [Sedimentisphaerales bacterium]|nr:SDR family oxidoreductase [Sedimentisphaerales bacterium]